ncbi:hypothetical protein RRG08_064187 [Elysia crispata]|uniref:Uncharacterized protein n=1 Tax=Elysia crispata TaxID=231223 RepID=A0AAE0YGQ7_9GAST|nr:hypothetical protein RRG08_064187 [Elysia crispata]
MCKIKRACLGKFNLSSSEKQDRLSTQQKHSEQACADRQNLCPAVRRAEDCLALPWQRSVSVLTSKRVYIKPHTVGTHCGINSFHHLVYRLIEWGPISLPFDRVGTHQFHCGINSFHHLVYRLIEWGPISFIVVLIPSTISFTV